MKRRLLSVFVLVLLAGSPAYAQTLDNMYVYTSRSPATGPRMAGMAGVGMAGVADYGALRTNPAGLGYFKNSEAGGSLHAFSATDASKYLTGIRMSSEAETDVRTTRLGNLAWIQKFPTSQGSFVLGAALNELGTFDRNLAFAGTNSSSSISASWLPYSDEFTIDKDDDGYYPVFSSDILELAYEGGAIEFLEENVETDGALFYEAVAPGTRIGQTGDVLEKGRMHELSLGGAWEASRNVMVGLSANFAFGSYRIDNAYEEEDAYGENTAEDYEVILPAGSLLGFQRLRYEEGFDSDLSGFNVRGGVSTTFSSGLRAGLSIETPTFYEISETHYRELATWFDEGGSLDAEIDYQYEYELRTPWRIGGGVSWELGNLLLAVDMEYVDWSQTEFDGHEADSDAYRDLNREIRDTMEPVWNMRLGASYAFGSITLRGGIANYPDSFDLKVSEGSGESDRDRGFLSLGASYSFSDQFHVDAAWTGVEYRDQYSPYLHVADPPLVEENITKHRFLLGVRVGF